MNINSAGDVLVKCDKSLFVLALTYLNRDQECCSFYITDVPTITPT